MPPLAALAIAGCLAVAAPDDQIHAGDLARALPEWSTVAPETPVLPAPAPGVQRVLRYQELRRLAARFNITAEPSSEPCFSQPVALLQPDRVLESMQKQLPNARIALIDTVRVPAPEGPVEFPLANLHSGYWFGYIPYGKGHRYIIWARVQVSVPLTRLTASADLKPGQPIESTQFRTESVWGPPVAGSQEKLDDISGWVPKRAIASGTAIDRGWLEPPSLIHRGDIVKVQVTAGAAHLEAEAIAESNGGLGDTISVQNRDSKRRFRARVEGAGRVTVKAIL